MFLTVNNLSKKNLNLRYYFKRKCPSKSTKLQGSLSAIMLQSYTIRWAGIATGYGWTVRGSNSGRGRDFLHASRPSLVLTQPPIHWVPVLSLSKAAETWRWPSTPSNAEVKERVGQYIYSPSGLSWLVLGLTWPFTLDHKVAALVSITFPTLPTRIIILSSVLTLAWRLSRNLKLLA
jgi:hypothetical protein